MDFLQKFQFPFHLQMTYASSHLQMAASFNLYRSQTQHGNNSQNIYILFYICLVSQTDEEKEIGM